jgi:hypothetical protein
VAERNPSSRQKNRTQDPADQEGSNASPRAIYFSWPADRILKYSFFFAACRSMSFEWQFSDKPSKFIMSNVHNSLTEDAVKPWYQYSLLKEFLGLHADMLSEQLQRM